MNRRSLIQQVARIAGGVLLVYVALLIVTTVIDIYGPMGLDALRGHIEHSLAGELLIMCALATCLIIIGEHSCHAGSSGDADRKNTPQDQPTGDESGSDAPTPENGD